MADMDIANDTFTTALDDAARGLGDQSDPDGWPVRQALLLAERAAVVAAHCPPAETAKWDLYAAAIGDAIAELQAELPDPAILPAALQPGRALAAGQLQTGVAALVRRLVELYADAAAGEGGSPWRRLVWAQVAHRLDAAVRQLA